MRVGQTRLHQTSQGDDKEKNFTTEQETDDAMNHLDERANGFENE